MSQRVSFGRLASGRGGGSGGGAFRILLMGDFSARGHRGLRQPLAGRKITFLDVDDWEGVLAALGSEVHVSVPGRAGAAIVIRPEEIDDFHPEWMFDKLEVFRALRGLRKRLMDSGTFDQAAAEVRSWVAGVEPAAEAAPQAGGPSEPPASPQAGEGEGQGDLLGRLLGERPAHVGEPASRPAPGGAGIDALLRDIVAPHVVPDRDREQSALAARVDEAVAAQMRAILHDAHFQAAEAAWRSVHFLVTHLETDEDLKLYVMDLTKEELADDLTAGEDLQATALFRTLVSQTVGTQGGEPWSVLAGGFRFDKTAGDASLLGRLAKIARAAGAPFVGAAHDRVAGCESLAASPDPESWSLPPDADAAGAWAELRKLPEASWLALGLPRMLLRLPYGRETDPIDAFELEELAEGCGHECYLWGSPAFAIAQVLGAGFTEHGWGMAAELYRDIESLPMHVYRREGERHVMPCAEVYLTDRAGQRLQEMGLTALLSVQGRDVIRVRGVAALREPVTALAGRWGA